MNGKKEPPIDKENAVILHYGLAEILSMLFSTLRGMICLKKIINFILQLDMHFSFDRVCS